VGGGGGGRGSQRKGNGGEAKHSIAERKALGERMVKRNGGLNGGKRQTLTKRERKRGKVVIRKSGSMGERPGKYFQPCRRLFSIVKNEGNLSQKKKQKGKR